MLAFFAIFSRFFRIISLVIGGNKCSIIEKNVTILYMFDHNSTTQ
jgi:hypothetical protein